MKVALAILIFFVVLCDVGALVNSIDKRRSVEERKVDLLTAVVLFAMVIVYAMFVYGGKL